MKNPFLSMWLSAANTAAGSARAFWTVEMQRQQKALPRASPHRPRKSGLPRSGKKPARNRFASCISVTDGARAFRTADVHLLP